MSAHTKTIAASLFIALALATNPIQARDPDCPGVRFQNGASGCCVGGTIDPPVLSVCAGWPICQGPTTTTWSQTPISCATIVTDGPSYSQLISSADSSMKASGTHFATRLDGGNVVETGSDSAVPGQTGSGSAPAPTGFGSASNSADSGSASSPTGSGQPAAATSRGAAADVVARVGLAGGAVLAAAAAAVL